MRQHVEDTGRAGGPAWGPEASRPAPRSREGAPSAPRRPSPPLGPRAVPRVVPAPGAQRLSLGSHGRRRPAVAPACLLVPQWWRAPRPRWSVLPEDGQLAPAHQSPREPSPRLSAQSSSRQSDVTENGLRELTQQDEG